MADDQIVVGGNGDIWTAPVGTAPPTSPSATPSAPWAKLGCLSEDGVTLTDSKSLESIKCWQEFYPARRIVTERDFTAAFTLRNWNPATVGLALGGATVTKTAEGAFKITPPDPQVVDQKTMLVDWKDGTKNYRLVIPAGMVTENVESNISRTAAADLAVTFGVLGMAGQAAWYILTDDPAFDPGAPATVVFAPATLPKAGGNTTPTIANAAKSTDGNIFLRKGAVGSGGQVVQSWLIKTNASGGYSTQIAVSAITDAGDYYMQTVIPGSKLPDAAFPITAT